LEGAEASRHVTRLFGGRREPGKDEPEIGPSPFRTSQAELAERYGGDRAAVMYQLSIRAGTTQKTVALLEKQKAGTITPAEREELERDFTKQLDQERLEAFRRYRAHPVDPKDTRNWGPQGQSPYGSVETDYLVTQIKGSHA
jgi:hypothetical protein